MLTKEQGKQLLGLVRKYLESNFDILGEREFKADENIKKTFSEKMGVFVSLHYGSQLRGCIGFTEPVFPLYKSVMEAAKAAAFNDPRFPPVGEAELKQIKLEISILTTPVLISDELMRERILKKIDIGQDGLIIEKGSSKGLLLPQVFPEWKADEKKALEMTCEKAGLSRDAWKDLKCKVYKFQAQIFSE